ncbi:MAG: HU family DNA-binding protein [Kiloniellales bacterium]
MSKTDLIDYVAENTGLSKKQASEAFDAAMEAIEHSIADARPGESIRVPGLGTFTVRQRKARMGRNPQTGAAIQIPASRSVGFKAAKSLKEAAAR